MFLTFYMQAQEDDFFNRKYIFPKKTGTVYELLSFIFSYSNYQLLYEGGVINNDAKSNLKKGEYTLPEAVHRITDNNNLQFKILGNHILIYDDIEKTINKPTISEPSINYFTIEGYLRDHENEPVTFATAMVNPTTISTVTNLDGYFKLILPDSLFNYQLKLSHVAYHSQVLNIHEIFDKQLFIFLKPKIIDLQEAIIHPVDANEIVNKMVRAFSKNYPSNPFNLISFYREGVNYNEINVSISEAVMNVYKTSLRNLKTDHVKLIKMRRIVNYSYADFLKLKAGVGSSLQLDIVKRSIDFFEINKKEGSFYNYMHKSNTTIDGRMAYIISFEQKGSIDMPLYCGEIYIDMDNYALLQADFEINPNYVAEATKMLITKSNRKIKLTLQKAKYSVSYKPSNGIYYPHHIRGDLHFKGYRKKWFSPNAALHTWFEMVTCNVDTINVSPIERNERLSSHTIFSETSFEYDDKFWGVFNGIMPEKKLRDAVLHLLNEKEIIIDELID